MKNQKIKTLLIILDVIAILISLFFIFRFSFQDAKKSDETSKAVTDFVGENVSPVKTALEEKKVTRAKLDSIIRSLAHAFEFSILGAEMMLLLLLLPVRPLKFTVYLPYFVCLMLGVLDECLQMTNDRASEVIDVVKDFAGSVLGGLVVLLVYAIILRVMNKKALTKKN